MLKRLLSIFFIVILVICLLINNKKIIPTFMDDGEYTYHFYYDNLTTNYILDELSVLANYDVDIYIIVNVNNNQVDYAFNSKNMKIKLGEFFNYCVMLLDNQDDINKAYAYGFKVTDIVIRMNNSIADVYLSSKKNIKYRIFE